MSLIHWWPLNGNTNDLGLNPISLTNNGATVNSAGKIGSCYYFNSTILNSSALDLSSCSTGCSLAIWAKIPTSHSIWSQIFVLGTSGTSWNNIRVGIDINSSGIPYFNVSNGSSNTNINSGTAIKDGIWHHICGTYDGTNLKLYIDGALVKTGTTSYVPALSSAYIYIGGNAGGEKFIAGYLNDARIYDHALSAKEIKEISKGLVLHYNFEDEYIEPTTNLAAGIAGYDYISKDVEAYATTVKGKTQYENKVYTFRVYIKNTSAHPLSVRVSPYNATDTDYSAFRGNLIAAGQEGYSSVTVDLTNTANWNGKATLYIQNGNSGSVPESKTFYIKEVQFEQKDHATPYVNGTRSAGKVYDNSGYGYNSTAAENLQIIANSSSGQHSVALNGSSTKITTPFTCQNFGNDFTVSAWLKSNVNSGGYLTAVGNETSTSGIVFAELTSTNRLQCYISASNGSDINICSYTSFAANTWYHVVYTVKNALSSPEAKLYINGALVSTVTGTSAFNETTEPLYIGCNKSYRFWNGLMSDFKIYATALSADDVLLEYNRKAAIDKNGNLFTGEVIENGNSQELLWTHKASDMIQVRSGSGPIAVTEDKSITFTNNVWGMSPMIPVTAGETLYYDITYSNVSGNKIYIGYEFYNASNGSNENRGCNYKVAETTARDHYRVKGTLTVPSTAGGSATTKLRLRILNGWEGTNSNSGILTIHHISLRRISSIAAPKIDKNNYIIANDFREYNYNHQTSLYKDGFVAANKIEEL